MDHVRNSARKRSSVAKVKALELQSSEEWKLSGRKSPEEFRTMNSSSAEDNRIPDGKVTLVNLSARHSIAQSGNEGDVSGAHVKKVSTVSFQEASRFWYWLRILLAETVGTGLLLTLGCMSLSIFPDKQTSPIQSAVSFGMVVSSLIQVFGHISGAHFNPAVTACFFTQGTISFATAVVYFVGEMSGATLGYLMLKVVSPSGTLVSGGTNVTSINVHESPTIEQCFCCTLPHASMNDIQSVLVEFIATSLLILTVCSCTDPVNESKQDSVPLKFGLLIIALSISAGPYTGASMNPARTFGPALINWNWKSHWVYWIGPLSAGFIMPVFYQIVFLRR